MADFELAALLARNEENKASLALLIGQSKFADVSETYHGPMDFAQDADEINVDDLTDAAELEPNFLVKEGFGALVAQWGADVPVELSTPVKRLRWDGPGVVAETRTGQYRGPRRRGHGFDRRSFARGLALRARSSRGP